MSKTKVKLLLLLLFPLALLLNYLFGLMPLWGETFYSTGINKWFIQILSHTVGIFPFSFFEFGIYIGVIALIAYTLYTLFKCVTNLKTSLRRIGQYLLTLGAVGATAFFAFQTFWGLNYKRPSFSDKYGLTMTREYTSEELALLYQHLLDEAAAIRPLVEEDENGVMIPSGTIDNIFDRAYKGFEVASQEFTTLGGSYGGAKPIFASEVLNYTGITGIYSPFTGEPNVNTAIPPVTLPSTTCHEMAHQRGYGFENECNFIAYITCLSHPDPDFQYSGLIMGIAYTSNALATADVEELIRINSTMDEKVFRDLQSINLFWEQYEGEVQEVAEEVNNTYLQSNGVASGTASYGEMVNLLLVLYDNYN